MIDFRWSAVVELNDDLRAVPMYRIGYPSQPGDELVVPDRDLRRPGRHGNRRHAGEHDEAGTATSQRLVERNDAVLHMTVKSNEVGVLGRLDDPIAELDTTDRDR